MTTLLISVDVGGTLGHAHAPGLTAALAAASPLDPRQARRIMRERLHTAPEITEAVKVDVCAALGIPLTLFPVRLPPPRLRLFPDALPSLRQLSNHGIVVTLSNVTCVDADTGLQQQLAPWVTDHFPSHQLGYAKPDSRAFRAVADHYHVNTASMAHIGDDWECDTVGAAIAGVTAIWISHGRSVPDERLLARHDVRVADDLAAAARHVHTLATRRSA